MHIRFRKANTNHQELIFEWLAEAHVKEFWDNSQEHKDDILNFINGRRQHYFCGTTVYWIGYVDDQPYSFLLSDQLLSTQEDLSVLHKKYLSKTGHTISIDFCIGNKHFLGKGLGALTLKSFTEFYKETIDPKADTFFIDPIEHNSRAKHVYEKAGFKLVGNCEAQLGYFKDNQIYLMVKYLMKGL
jgi:RimJ/RimL family protein N-acetyltransferase